jgi:hypothetical protein
LDGGTLVEAREGNGWWIGRRGSGVSTKTSIAVAASSRDAQMVTLAGGRTDVERAEPSASGMPQAMVSDPVTVPSSSRTSR